MPKFIVTKSVDAHVHYAAVVEADTPDLAKQFAQEHEDELAWRDVGTSEYDERDWDNIEAEKVDDTFEPQSGLGSEPLHADNSRKPTPIESLRQTASGRARPDPYLCPFIEQ